MKLTWLTDIHLNFLESDARQDFYLRVSDTDCDGVLISGDIAEAPSIELIMIEMAEAIQKPIYFVLGNHDYYRGEIATVKKQLTLLSKTDALLHWLPASGPKVLQNGVVLLGQDGWADGRYGNYARSRVALNDSRLIAELFQAKMAGRFGLLDAMQQLADADATQLQRDCLNAIETHHAKKIIILTHVPPFKTMCLYEGKISGDDFLPFFGSKATGDVLLELVSDNPSVEFLVLCGHTHHAACYQPLENLVVKVGQAEYYGPGIQDVFTIEGLV